MVSGYMFSLIISRNFASVLTHHHGWATGRASIGELENIGAAAHRRPSATAQLRLRTKFSNFRDSQSSMIITIKILTCPILHASACLIGETRNQDMIHLKCRNNGETAHSCCQGDSDPLVDTTVVIIATTVAGYSFIVPDCENGETPSGWEARVPYDQMGQGMRMARCRVGCQNNFPLGVPVDPHTATGRCVATRQTLPANSATRANTDNLSSDIPSKSPKTSRFWLS